MKYKDKRVCVVDYGLHVELALTLSKDFGHTDYYMAWKEDYPRSTRRNIGTGFDQINRIYEFTDSYIDSVDLFVFPCILDGTLQLDLEKRGKRVWGSRDAELLEIDRKGFIEYQKKVGMPIPPTEYVTGLDELRKKIGKTGIKWIKANSNVRGDVETFKVDNRQIANDFDFKALEYDLGHSAQTKEFIIQDNIENVIVETGFDGFTIDGKFPDSTLFGIEAKDKGYVGEIRAYKDLPECIKFTNSKLAPALKAYGMRGNISTEIKDVGDGKGYCIDPTMRFPYPPCNILLAIWDNIAECIYEGSAGTMIQPVFKAKYGIEVEMFAQAARKKEYYTLYPDSLSEWVKIPYSMYQDGKKIVLPQDIENNNVGSIVAIGDSIDDCIKKAKEIAKQIKGHHLEIDFQPIEDAKKDFLKL